MDLGTPPRILEDGTPRETKSCSRVNPEIGKEQVGSALKWSLHLFELFDRGTFWVLTLTYFYLAKSARTNLFPQSDKNDYFCSGPISVDPNLSATTCVFCLSEV